MAEGTHPISILVLEDGSPQAPLPLSAIMAGDLRLSEEVLATRQRTTALIYATAMLERMDEQIFPAVRRTAP